jgi:hypothetical protein
MRYTWRDAAVLGEMGYACIRKVEEWMIFDFNQSHHRMCCKFQALSLAALTRAGIMARVMGRSNNVLGTYYNTTIID